MRIGYIRVSTQQQVEGLSLDRQEERLRAYGVDKVLIDIESGRKANRKEYQHLLKLIEQKTVTQVVAIRLDRLGRSTIELLRFNELCQKYGVDIHVLDTPIPLTGTYGKLTFNVMSTLAEIESDNISARVKDSWQFKRDNVLAHKPPFGYCAKEGKYVIVEHQAKILRELVDVILQPTSLAFAVRYANDKYKDIKKWNPSGLLDLLKNPVLRGHSHYKEPKTKETILIRDTHTPIWSEEEYQKFLSLLKINNLSASNSKTRPMNILSGLVYCAVCGGRMNISNSSNTYKGKRYEYRFFRCRKSGDGLCTNTFHTRYPKAVKAVEEKLQEYAPMLAEQLGSHDAPTEEPLHVKDLKEQLKTLESIPNPIQGVIDSIAQIKKELANLELDAQLKIQNDLSLQDLVYCLSQADFISSMSDIEKASIFSDLIDSVVIDCDRRISVNFK